MTLSAYGLSLSDVLHALSADDGAIPRGRRKAGASDVDAAVEPVQPTHPPADEQAIVAEIRAGNERALERIFTEHYTDLRTIVTLMTGTSASADEVVDDVFETLWRLRAEWNPVYGVRAYLVRAVRNRARNALRAEAARRHAEAAAVAEREETLPPAADAQMDADDLARVVWGVIEGLPEASQLVLALRWRHGLAWEAIAHAMGTSVGAVQMQHHRACKLLRQRLPHHLG